jgi:hypothetical protein
MILTAIPVPKKSTLFLREATRVSKRSGGE